MTFVVTGGSRGIGKAIVLDAARAGHAVAFTYATKPELAREVVEIAKSESPGSQVKAYELDVRSSTRVDEVVEQITDDFGEISVLVNNAGINRPGLAMSMSDEDWKDVIDTNLTGAFFMVRAVLPHFLANRKGSFIHVSSIATYGISGQISYCAAKAGLLGLSRGLAKEYGP
jgi:NAD(P)-dependent dehydrogenase (short-subunit alcohol dehydrogenase family)